MQASTNMEMKKSIADIDQDVGKYASLLASILNVQKQRSRTPPENRTQPAKSAKAPALVKKPKPAQKVVQPTLDRKKKSVLRPQSKPINTTKPAKPVQSSSKISGNKSVVTEKPAKQPAEVQPAPPLSPKQVKEPEKTESESEQEQSVLNLILHLAKNLKEDKNFLSSLVAKLNESKEDKVADGQAQEPDPPEPSKPTTETAEPNYSDRISQLEKQIQELSVMNSNLKNEYENSCKMATVSNQLVPHLPCSSKPAPAQSCQRLSIEQGHNLAPPAVQMRNEFVIEKLRQDLTSSNQRCKMLEQMLEQKCLQVDKYGQIFKETNEKLRYLLNEIGEKQSYSSQATAASNYIFSPSSHLQDSFVDSMRKNLIDLQSKLLKCENKFSQHRPPPPPLESNVRPSQLQHQHQQQSYLHENYKPTSFRNQEASSATTHTGSDTLVDADSSFDSLNLDLLLKKNSLHAKRHSDDEEEEQIEIDLGELSFMTLQTATSASACSTTATAKTADSVSTLKSQDDVIFQDGLKKLDEKIYKVKQLLESIRPA